MGVKNKACKKAWEKLFIFRVFLESSQIYDAPKICLYLASFYKSVALNLSTDLCCLCDFLDACWDFIFEQSDIL